jgi:predicted PurR-regulated permease PerM
VDDVAPCIIWYASRCVSLMPLNAILQRVNLFLALLVLVTVVLYFGQPLLTPLFLGALFAMLMAPLCRRLDKKTGRVWSSTICTLIIMFSLLIILGVGAFQIAVFVEDLPLIRERGTEMLGSIKSWVYEQFSIAPAKQESLVRKQLNELNDSASGYATKMLGSLTSTLTSVILALLFTFLFLYNKERYESFFVRLFKEKDPGEVKSIVAKISRVSEQYVLGRTYSIIILFICYTIGLLIIGIDNALLLAAVASLFTIIPYVGTIVGSIFPVVMAIVTEDSNQPALWTALLMISVQTIDNYFIEPFVVGGEVNLSAMATIVTIVCGGLIWGIAGTVLFIPLLGIIKIVCDHVEPLKPYGFLVGDPSGNKPSKITLWISDFFKKKAAQKKSR